MIQTGMVTGWEDKMNIREELGKRMLFFDGGLGSLLQARGLKPGELPETWNLSKPEELLAIHKAVSYTHLDVYKRQCWDIRIFQRHRFMHR